MFDQVIKTPSHEKIVLSDGTTAFVDPLDGRTVRLSVPLQHGLDQNDVIRLAAWLNRNFRERNQAEIRAMGEQTKASREAKKQRSAGRRLGLSPVTDYTVRVNGGEPRTIRTAEIPK